MDRERKGRAAGFRTYILVSLGAALTMILGQYEAYMLSNVWTDVQQTLGVHLDVSRFGAQVINGVGFLGAGTIIVTGRQEVKGLTTAAGLWASACMGLTSGAGFYECVLISFLLIFLSVRILPVIEYQLMANARNINIYIEFDSLDAIEEIVNKVKSQQIQIYEVEIQKGKEDNLKHVSAVLLLRLARRMPHAEVLANLSELSCIRVIEEI